MINLNFTVGINGTSDIDVDVEVSIEEFLLIQKYADESSFDVCEELAPLRQRVIDEAYQTMADYADEEFLKEFMDVDEDYDIDDIVEAMKENFNLYFSWPRIEEMSDDVIESALNEMIHVFCTDPRFKYQVFEDDPYYFACSNDQIFMLSSLTNDSPKGGYAYEVFTGPTQEEREALLRIIEQYGIDTEFFVPLLDYLIEYGEGLDEDWTLDDVESSVMEMYDFDPDNDDEDDADPEMVTMLDVCRTVQTEIDAGNSPFASISDFSVKLRRYDLDEGTRYYFYEGEYIDLWDNICSCGEFREDCSDMSDEEWLELLIEIYFSAE